MRRDNYLDEEGFAFRAEGVESSERAVELGILRGLEAGICRFVVVVLSCGDLELTKVFLSGGGGPSVGPVF